MDGRTQRPPGRRILLLLALLLVAALVVWLRSRTGTDRSVPPFSYIRDKAEALGMDRERIVAFVDESIRPLEYEGVLRGAVGTLWAGSGNDLDRAILLTALLRETGATVRLARGDRWGVQEHTPEGWRTIGLDRDTPIGTVAWTGETPDATHFHTIELELALESDTEGNPARTDTLTLHIAEAIDHPPLLRFTVTESILEGPDGKKAVVPRGIAPTETLWLRIRHLRPDGTEAFRRTREIYTGAFETFPALDHPDNRHLIAILPLSMLAWVVERETARIEAGDRPLPTEADRDNYATLLAHLLESDAGLRAIREHFGTEADYLEPRILIASTFRLPPESGRPSYRALDLRRNSLTVLADEPVRSDAAVTHAILEGAIEKRTIETLAKGPTTTAFDVFRTYAFGDRPSTASRIPAYERLLDEFLRNNGPGAVLRLALDAEREIHLRRTESEALEIATIDPPLRAAMRKADVPWTLLSGEVPIPPDRFGDLAVEIEALLGPAAGSAVDYLPSTAVDASVLELLIENARIFRYNRTDEEGRPQLTFSYEFTGTEGDLTVDVLDYWNELEDRAQEKSIRYTIPEEHLESSHILSTWYSAERARAGSMNLILSRTMVRELQETGETVYRYMKQDKSLTEPIRLFLCERFTATIRVNGREQEIPFLRLAGTWDADDPVLGPADEYPDIDEPHPDLSWAINQWTALDHPRFPLLNIQGSFFQTRINGRVVSTAGGVGIPDAEIEVVGTRAAGRSWGDGSFFLPIVRKPFGRFTVRARADGYRPFEMEADFREADTFPLRIVMEPDPASRPMTWITPENRETTLPTIPDPHVRRLVGVTLDDNPDAGVLIPATPVPHGPDATWAWLLFDRRRMEVVGVTEDGLHGAASYGYQAARWAGGRVRDEAVSTYVGFISSWYVYSAGRLDAIDRGMPTGELPPDAGHSHAREFALRWLEGMQPALDSWVAQGVKMRGEAFRRGFRSGLAFFEKNPAYSGG